MASAAEVVETPSGKGAADENFPVGSFLLPSRLRPHVAIFYGFARAIDDIADNPALAPEDKVARLDGFDRALLSRSDDPAYAKATAIRASLAETHVTVQHCRDLISAFKQDAVKGRYAGWDELIDYCLRSAAPVGRYLLDLHGETPTEYRGSDALCNALQILNHLQDCADDYRSLDRVYLPGDWMAAAGTTVEDLTARQASAGLRQVIDRCLDGVDDLLATARPFPKRLKSKRLAMESAAIIRIAERLSRELRHRDPVAARVELTKPQFIACCLTGVRRVFF